MGGFCEVAPYLFCAFLHVVQAVTLKPEGIVHRDFQFVQQSPSHGIWKTWPSEICSADTLGRINSICPMGKVMLTFS